MTGATAVIVIFLSFFSFVSLGDMYSEEERKKNGDEPDWLKTEKEQFGKYRDKNGDGYLDKVDYENRSMLR